MAAVVSFMASLIATQICPLNTKRRGRTGNQHSVTEGGGAFASGDFVDVLAHFPDAVVPERRKRRAYISSILAKNEVNRDDRYNRRLFRRVKHGHYIIDPNLSFWVEGSWRNAYDLLNLDSLAYDRVGLRGDDPSYAEHIDAYALREIERFKELVEELRGGGGDAA